MAPGYLEWKAIRVKDAILPVRDDSVQPANPLPEKMPTEIEVEKRKNIDLDHRYHTKLGQCQYFQKIQGNKVKDERKERELFLEDFKKLGIKNKRLEDELKRKKVNSSKRIKLTESTQRELKEA